MSKSRKPTPTVVCPHCGATFRAGRLACPECGSDERTGWKSGEEIDYQSIDLADDDEAPVATGMPRWLVVAIVIVLVFALVRLFIL